MTTQRRAMGNGVQSLFQGSGYRKDTVQSTSSIEERNVVTVLSIDVIERNLDQPRKAFSEESLEELALSIKEHGLLQPIIVVKHPHKYGLYQIVAGERRFRAVKKLGYLEIPAIIRSFSQKEIAIISLLENIQREDLNIMEEANALFLLKEEFNVTQEEMAKELGRSRPTIANTLRLLQLPEEIQLALTVGHITQGHAMILLRVDTVSDQIALCDEIIKKGYSVKETTALITAFMHSAEKDKKITKKSSDSLECAKNVLSEYFGVPIQYTGSEHRGKLIVSFRTNDELNSIVSKLKK
ncbi:MAG: ParB/RepB/Spo0J family partition protein [Desulfovibrionaceae bacterium]